MRTSVDVHNYLLEREIPHEVFTAPGRLRTPEHIAAVLDLSPSEIGKVAIYDGAGGPLAAIVPSDAEPDSARVAEAAGDEELVPASAARGSELSEYVAEAIPPAGLPPGFKVLLDQALDRDDVLYFAGGEPRAVLKIRGKDLARATDASVAPLTRR